MTGARYFAKQHARQRDAQIKAMRNRQAGFADNIDGAIIAQPCIAVHAATRVRTYTSAVIRRGSHPERRVRVAVYARDCLVILYTRSPRGWEVC